MRRRFLLLIMMMLPFMGAAPVRGEMVPFAYSYTFVGVTYTAYGSGPISLSHSYSEDQTTLTIYHGNSWSTLTLPTGGTSEAVAGGVAPGQGTRIPFVSFGASEPTATLSTIHFAFDGWAYVDLKLTDLNSAEETTLTFLAALRGEVGPEGAVRSGYGIPWSSWEENELGGHYYKVGLTEEEWFSFPGNLGEPFLLPLEINVGSFEDWEAYYSTASPMPNDTPEPSSLVLGLTASLAAVGAIRRRLRRTCR